MFHTLQMHNESQKENLQFGRFRWLVFHICRSGFLLYHAFVELALAEWGVLQRWRWIQHLLNEAFCAIIFFLRASSHPHYLSRLSKAMDGYIWLYLTFFFFMFKASDTPSPPQPRVTGWIPGAPLPIGSLEIDTYLYWAILQDRLRD
jgi:hypothetical protein